MRNIEALTLLESENSVVPNIGTVQVGWNKRELVEQKMKNVIEAHFDRTLETLPEIDWAALEGYQDIEVQVKLDEDGHEYTATVLIQRTAIY